MGRAQSDRALLDHQLRAGVGGPCNLEAPLMMHSVVVGLGKTGASCLRYLAKRGLPVSATDTRRAPPGLAELGGLADSLDLRLGGFDLSLLDGASQVLMSPGVSLDEPIARAARDRGIDVLGDVELFARNVQAPVIGITGTNGKSTVTSLVARMAAAAGRTVLAGGNLGDPALDLLEQPTPDLYVLELSSFQLETTYSLRLQAAVVLNVTADHLDRYPSVAAYALAKSRIFAHAATVVLNVDDPLVAAMRGGTPKRTVTFSIERRDADFTVVQSGARTLLALRGKVRHAVLIGRDAPAVAAALAGVCTTETVASMQEAVAAAARIARAGDTVLLSPACASLDMFRDYGHRGDVFADAVRELERRPA